MTLEFYLLEKFRRNFLFKKQEKILKDRIRGFLKRYFKQHKKTCIFLNIFKVFLERLNLLILLLYRHTNNRIRGSKDRIRGLNNRIRGCF